MRLIMEKPFGVDLTSAQQLGADLGFLFDEKQLYRVDHFIGLEITQVGAMDF